VALHVSIHIFAAFSNLILRSNSYVVLVELEDRCVESILGHRRSFGKKF
jgi:hypothetical protein